jgi:hypothetical protein
MFKELFILFLIVFCKKSWGSAFYSDWLRAGQQKGSEFDSQYGKEFLLLHIIETSSVAHPASCPLCTRALSLEVKAARALS